MPIGDIGAGIGGAIGGIAVLAGAGGKGGDKYYKQALSVWRKIQDPNFDFRDLTAPELKIFGEVFPEVYEAIVPAEVRQIADSPEMRAAQIQGLGQIQEAGREGLPLVDRIAAQKIQDRMAMEGKRSGDAVIRDLAQRGQLCGGEEVVARMAGGQQAMNMAGQMGADLAQEAALNRIRFAGAGAELAGNIRGQDVSTQAQNANMMNRFNELVANMQTQAARDAAQTRSQAQQYNVGTRQRIGEENIMNRYGTQLENLTRKNQLEQALFGARMSKASGLSEALQRYGLKKDQDKAARERNIQQLGSSIGQVGGGLLGGLI